MPRCTNGCNYKISTTGDLVVCEVCGRVKAIRELGGNPWKILH